MSASVAPCLSEWESPRPHLALCPPPAVPRGERGPRALREIVIRMMPALLRRARRWCRDAAEAEDLTQETLLRSLSSGTEFRSDQHLEAWLHTVLRNLFISRRRQGRVASTASARLAAEAGSSSPPPQSHASFLTRSVQRALAELPEVFAQVIVLVDLEGYAYADAAQKLGVPVGTVMSRLSRGRRRLASTLADAR